MNGAAVMVELFIDQRKISAPDNQTLLSACLENGIFIPNLCFLEDGKLPEASCRLCFVEVEGMPGPVPACTITVSSGLQVRTDTPAVRQLQRSALKLLLSVHLTDCKHCHANRACSLQKIAGFLKVGLKAKPLETIPRPEQVDRSHPFIDHYPHRCVLCGKCVRVCRQYNEVPALTFSGRGFGTAVRHFPANADVLEACIDCRRCVDICPVGALAMREKQNGPPAIH